MGLEISVGVLAYLSQHDTDAADHFMDSLVRVNHVLQANDLPIHHEPETLPALTNRSAVQSFPYRHLHYLRRVYAHVYTFEGWLMQPFPKGASAADDYYLHDVIAMLSSHLLIHSATEGWYVPIEFDDPLISDEVVGGYLGSSMGLKQELEDCAPALGITLIGGDLSDESAEQINHHVRDDGVYSVERGMWLCLYEAARLSIDHNTAICFL